MASNEWARSQKWSADAYDRHARFVSDLAEEVLSWLEPRAGERILDLGCGDGVLSARLRDMGATVVAVDADHDMVRAARERGVDAKVMDGQQLPFAAEFDAVFSNAALHWMTNADLVLEGVCRALRPAGRFVAEFGGHGNVAAIVTGMRAVALRRQGVLELAGPWFFPTPEVYEEMLAKAGFTVKRIGLYARPTRLKTGMRAWLGVFRKPFFEQFGRAAEEAITEVENLLRPSLCDARGNWTADYVRLRVEAVKA